MTEMQTRVIALLATECATCWLEATDPADWDKLVPLCEGGDWAVYLEECKILGLDPYGEARDVWVDVQAETFAAALEPAL